MAWKTKILERIHESEKIADKYGLKAEAAHLDGDDRRKEKMYAKANRVEMWRYGAIDALEAIGYEIKYKDDGSVKSIDGEFNVEYRVRYRVRYENTGINEIGSLVCRSSAEVCAVIDRCKEFSSEYKALGIDTRIVFPNGEHSGWNKIFDF